MNVSHKSPVSSGASSSHLHFHSNSQAHRLVLGLVSLGCTSQASTGQPAQSEEHLQHRVCVDQPTSQRTFILTSNTQSHYFLPRWPLRPLGRSGRHHVRCRRHISHCCIRPRTIHAMGRLHLSHEPHVRQPYLPHVCCQP
jgi:hypothetical protein